ncbi:MAG: SsrA-binding protein SmpB [Bernardetiaceae bacterium]
MAKKKKEESPFKKTISIQNRKAHFDYHLMDKYIAGVVLKGTEIKSLRMGKANLQAAFCLFIGNELFVRQLHISEYKMGNIHNHEEKADRKLLLSKRELKKLSAKMEENGMAIIPTRIFINERGWAKLEIALAKGKKLYDKRETIKSRDNARDLARQD